jgi:hypothetical protein
MRKLLIAGLAVASLTGIAYGQAGQKRPDRPDENWAEAFLARNCRDAGNVMRDLGDIAQVGSSQFQCVQVWGDGLSGLRTGWLRITTRTGEKISN